MQQILEELKTVTYISVMVDTSNHKRLKLVLVLVQYFIPRKGVQTKVTEFRNFNTDFGGAARKGTNNVFAKLTT
jgi:hypothetical protein